MYRREAMERPEAYTEHPFNVAPVPPGSRARPVRDGHDRPFPPVSDRRAQFVPQGDQSLR
ncbi:hypothetical protein BDN71DRAFT_1457691 [Pleurotus eryngii]|uniref:Uncharacterized protein n=1 Tax=Pleurotus eryngii TaxID=5323 RepID=A0A9P5ZKA4_PLEER|nr:hypothetical protein BDN71DRAFT_1457691 [Pleurotus eryngii]